MLSGCIDRLSIKLGYAVDDAGDEQNVLYVHRNFTLLAPSTKMLPYVTAVFTFSIIQTLLSYPSNGSLVLTKNYRKSNPKVLRQPLHGYPQLLIYSPLPPYLRFVSSIRNMRMSHVVVSKEPLDKKDELQKPTSSLPVWLVGCLSSWLAVCLSV
jgi:hypothetical protein